MRTKSAVFVALLLAGCATQSGSGGGKRGALQQTGRALDLAIEGDGYFIFASSPTAFVFSRSGQLFMDSGGWLTNEDGYRLVPTEAIPPGATELRVERDGRVMAKSDASAELQEVAKIRLAAFPYPMALVRDGIYVTPASEENAPRTGVPGTPGYGAIVSGTLEE